MLSRAASGEVLPAFIFDLTGDPSVSNWSLVELPRTIAMACQPGEGDERGKAIPRLHA